MIKNICVFCGAKNGSNQNYVKAANEFGRILADNNIDLVYGGGSTGIMNEIAESVLKAGGKVTGVITHHLMNLEVGHKGLTKMHFVNTLQERKTLQMKISDAFVVLPGGIGTMDEFFEILVHLQLHLINKPIGILNTDNFYNPLLNLLNHFIQQGFVADKQIKSIICEENPEKLLKKIMEWKTVSTSII